MRRALPQICRTNKNGLCAEIKMCSPSLRICERNNFNKAIFALTDDALNDENHPLHEMAVCNYNFVEVPNTSESTVLAPNLPKTSSQLPLCWPNDVTLV